MMRELEKILEEIDMLYVNDIGLGVECNISNSTNLPCDNCYECIKDACKDIIRKHMPGKDTDAPTNDGCRKGKSNVTNKASNDLISREAVVNIIEAMIFESGRNLSKVYLLQDVKERIGRVKTAYNKKEVIEELKRPDNYTIMAGKHFTTVDRVVEIVEKGGLE